jgi:hypothetical protein
MIVIRKTIIVDPTKLIRPILFSFIKARFYSKVHDRLVSITTMRSITTSMSLWVFFELDISFENNTIKQIVVNNKHRTVQEQQAFADCVVQAPFPGIVVA